MVRRVTKNWKREKRQKYVKKRETVMKVNFLISDFVDMFVGLMLLAAAADAKILRVSSVKIWSVIAVASCFTDGVVVGRCRRRRPKGSW